MKLIVENWRRYIKEGLEERRADAKLFFDAQDGTLRELILAWIEESLPPEGVKRYHSRDDRWAGSDFARAEAQRYISEYFPNSPIEGMMNTNAADSEGDNWRSVGIEPLDYDAFLSFDTLIQTIKSMYEDSRMSILHNDLMKLGSHKYPGGIVHYSLLYFGRELISAKKRYERRRQ
tara:strand:- start:524 stop:1051 length:528 start_codon:yes stop_codon:yes gene_type:complete